MLDVGFSELLVFGIIALLVLGPEKLPEAARFAAKWYSKFKRAITSVQNDIDRELRLSEFREQMQQEMKRIQELEQKMQAQMNELQQQSILAAEQQKQAAPSDNKNFSYTFTDFTQLSTTVPPSYMAKVWLDQQHCTQHTIQTMNVQTMNTAELKVAV
ncbi:Sec-independent protein translocase protein TatB [Acinetobacter sp. P8-3-8]|uniref:Sec-independent protein translocase protein TatB n=1 Tax=Acinetobacter sp. P8-3-8 TaxID=1029823 RepID=UPI0002488042|nr:Sec-independent protein translocase protein TatB [Acinetobacter sp. P8-3-8]